MRSRGERPCLAQGRGLHQLSVTALTEGVSRWCLTSPLSVGLCMVQLVSIFFAFHTIQGYRSYFDKKHLKI